MQAGEEEGSPAVMQIVHDLQRLAQALAQPVPAQVAGSCGVEARRGAGNVQEQAAQSSLALVFSSAHRSSSTGSGLNGPVAESPISQDVPCSDHSVAGAKPSAALPSRAIPALAAAGSSLLHLSLQGASLSSSPSALQGLPAALPRLRTVHLRQCQLDSHSLLPLLHLSWWVAWGFPVDGCADAPGFMWCPSCDTLHTALLMYHLHPGISKQALACLPSLTGWRDWSWIAAALQPPPPVASTRATTMLGQWEPCLVATQGPKEQRAAARQPQPRSTPSARLPCKQLRPRASRLQALMVLAPAVPALPQAARCWRGRGC